MRVPSNRAGMSARCPGCKAVVVIPFPPSNHKANDVLDAVHASSAISSIQSSTPKAEEVSGNSVVKAKEIENKQTIVGGTIENRSTGQSMDMQIADSKPAEITAADKSLAKETEEDTPTSGDVAEASVNRKRKAETPSVDQVAKESPSKTDPHTAEEKLRSKAKKRRKKIRKPVTKSTQKATSATDVVARKPDAQTTKPTPPVSKVESPRSVPVTETSRPVDKSEKPKQGSLDAVFASVDSAISKDAEPLPKTPMNGNRAKVESSGQEQSESLSMLELKSKLKLPTVEPINRVEEKVRISTPETSSIEPEDFQFEDKLPEETAFDPEKSATEKMSAIEIRTRRANADRVTLTRFFAAMLVFVGLVNFAPAIYCWYTWSQVDIDFLLPRWIYLQIFIAVLHLVYAVLLIQVPDWSTLRSIAVVMLAFAFVFGLFSMGLLATGGNGLLAQFLQVPDSLGRQACIWCVAMLCLATLASYLAGRESNNWQRTERLLAEILANKEAV